MSSQSITVFVADSQPVFRHGLRTLLDVDPSVTIVGLCGTEAELTRGLGQFEPDVLFVDTGLSSSWLDIVRTVTTDHPRLHVIVTALALSDEQMIAALEHGARGILTRDAPLDLFARCARAVAAGQYWVGRQAVAGLVESLRRARLQHEKRPGHELQLTTRQLDVLRAVATSQTNREIATALGISEDTVKQHLTAIFDKCGVSNRVELALFAVRNNLVE